jgi:membrane protease YdiL (CAAX protease family)
MTDAPIPQYSLPRILLVWAAAAVPMAVLGWVVDPALAKGGHPGMERQAVLGAGLVWQFVLVLILIRVEGGNLSWSTLSERLWLKAPRDPATDAPRRRLWLWLIPVVLATAAFQMGLRGPIDRLWTTLLPALAQPPGWDFSAMLATPQARADIAGNWSVLALFVVTAIFNTVLGEELLFRGILLPRMAGVFGRWDWLANGVLFGCYHLHQPWGIAASILSGAFLYALPSRLLRCSWFGIVAHSGQSVFLTVLLLGLVLQLA